MSMKKYIDADALKAKLRLWVSDCIVECDDESADVMRACIDLIDDAPAADVAEVVHGRWTVGYEMCDKSVLYDCSECGRTITVKTWQSVKDYPFCHCGAKMDGEKEGADRE